MHGGVKTMTSVGEGVSAQPSAPMEEKAAPSYHSLTSSSSLCGSSHTSNDPGGLRVISASGVTIVDDVLITNLSSNIFTLFKKHPHYPDIIKSQTTGLRSYGYLAAAIILLETHGADVDVLRLITTACSMDRKTIGEIYSAIAMSDADASSVQKT
jgi:hypothetical protein